MAIDVLGNVSGTKHREGRSELTRVAERALLWAVRLFLIGLVLGGLALPYV
jgi:hypothetical protein